MNRLFSAINCITVPATAMLLFACGNEEPGVIDTEPPVIEVSDPSNGTFIDAGGYAHFEALFFDNAELGSYDIDIHNTFDGHSHGRIAQAQNDPSLLKWSYKQSFMIPPGRVEYSVNSQDVIAVPANAMAGPYHFIVQAVDASGNATSYADGSTIEREVYITNGSQPQVQITNLENDELKIEANQLFIVEGAISDPTQGTYAGIHSVQIILGEDSSGDHDHMHDGRLSAENATLMEVVYEESALEPFLVNGVVQLGPLFQEINFVLSTQQVNDLVAESIDHLVLTIKAFDEQGNIAFSFTDVHVHVN